MDWSFQLLSPEEQALLAQLAVFAGGFSLDAVAAVCLDGDDDLALELLERLVDASLVIADMREERTRYRLLETVREYAAERLDETGARAAELRRRHAEYFLRLAEANAREVIEDGRLVRLSVLITEDANLVAAYDHFAELGLPEQSLRFGAALWRYWWLHGQLREGRRRLDAALSESSDGAVLVRVDALLGASTLAARQADHEAAAALANAAVSLADEHGDRLARSRARMALANAVSALGDHDRAEALYRESAAGFRAEDSRWELANVFLNMADLALNRADFDTVERVGGESLALCHACEDDAGIAVNLGNIAFAALERGETDRAHDLLVEGLRRSQRLGFGEWVATMLEGLAAVESARGSDPRSALLLGASARLQEEIGMSLGTFEDTLHARTTAAVRERLGEEAFVSAWKAGRELTTDDAVARALARAPARA